MAKNRWDDREPPMPRKNRGKAPRGERQLWGSPRKRHDPWRPDERWALPDPTPGGRRQRKAADLSSAAGFWLAGERALPAGAAGADIPGSAPAHTCRECHEWLPHEEGGRGSCLHPGSGFTSPWADTAACAFFVGRR